MRRGWVCLLCTLFAVSALAQPRYERMTAMHQTVVSAHEASGVVGMFTYDHDPQFWLGYLALGKLLVGVEAQGRMEWLHEARDLQVRNIPTGEGVEVTATVAGRRVRIEALPTARGRETQQWEGSALFVVRVEPTARLVLRYGGIGRVRIHGFRPQLPQRLDYLNQPDLLPTSPEGQETQLLAGDTGILRTAGIPLTVVFRVQASRPVQMTKDGAFVRIDCGETGRVYLLSAFAGDEARARQLASQSPERVEQECRERFRILRSQAWIQTPSREMNDAFRWAIIHMEWSWVRPYGWIEGLRHWGTFYSQQHNMAADWIGQANRSREMLLTHAEHLLPNGTPPAGRASHREARRQPPAHTYETEEGASTESAVPGACPAVQ